MLLLLFFSYFEIIDLTAEQLCNGDMKVFTYQTDKFRGGIGFAVIETTGMKAISIYLLLIYIYFFLIFYCLLFI